MIREFSCACPVEYIYFQKPILVPRSRAPFGQHQESRPLAKSNTGSPRFTDFPSLCACSESSLTNLIGSGLNLLCLQSHSKTDFCWTRPEVAILGADQRERGLWGRECQKPSKLVPSWYLKVPITKPRNSETAKHLHFSTFPLLINETRRWIRMYGFIASELSW